MISPTIRRLFGDTPRQTGWYRKMVYTPHEFEHYIESANGKEEVYTNAYPLDGTLESVTFDFDKKGAYEDAKKVYRWAQRKNFPAVPVVSGRKGYHVLVLSLPITVANPKEVLMDISVQIMQEALGVHDWQDASSCDWHLVGNQSAMIRVPMTLRVPENDAYCSFLPPDWCTLSETETLRFTKSPSDFKYDLSPKRSLLEILSQPLTPSDLILDSDSIELAPKGTIDFHGDYTYIQKLLLHPVSDGRHRLVRFVLAPYFANIIGSSPQEGCNIIGSWLGACEKIHPTDARRTLSHDYAYAKAKKYIPRSLNTIKSRDPDLYEIISTATGLKR